MSTTEQAATCSVGSATEAPCDRLAVVVDGEDGPRFCERHLKVVRYQEFVGEVQTFLEFQLAELNEWADSPE